jgi:hypothetical protein
VHEVVTISLNSCNVQVLGLILTDRKVTPPILQYPSMAAIEYISMGLINTLAVSVQEPEQVTSFCNMLGASPSHVFKQSKCKDIFFTSVMSVHFQTPPGISFFLNLLK